MKSTNNSAINKENTKVAKATIIELSPLISSTRGAFTASNNFDYKKELSKKNSL